MALSAARPAAIRGVVLNDIGPVIEAKGLVRIRGYVGKLPTPRNLAEAADILRNLFTSQFPRFGEEDWRAMARGMWTEKDGVLRPDYDPALRKTLETIDLERPLPHLWFMFQGLKPFPVLALRGANSDLLSAETLDTMAKSHPDLEAVTIPDQGHTPALRGREMIQRIRRFVVRAENGGRPTRPNGS
jgi:pimeloyl-ACP methyl ester carboxylesterase